MLKPIPHHHQPPTSPHQTLWLTNLTTPKPTTTPPKPHQPITYYEHHHHHQNLKPEWAALRNLRQIPYPNHLKKPITQKTGLPHAHEKPSLRLYVINRTYQHAKTVITV